MAKDASKVRVALTGEVWAGAENADFPTTISEPVSAADFTNLGYTTEDGVTFTFGKEVEKIMGWQSSDALRILVTEEPKNIEFTLRQIDSDTWLNAMGGTLTEPDNALHIGEFEWHPPAPGTNPVKTIIVEFTDDTIHYRLMFRRSQDTGEKTFQLLRTDAVNLPANYEVLAATPDWGFMQTDDPALAPAA